MTAPLVVALQEARSSGRSQASAELARLGFRFTDAGWIGSLSDGERRADITIRLPEAFPDALPIITLRDPSRYPSYAHVEHDGKLCLAPTSGTLLDDNRPEQIVADAIRRAELVLFPSEDAHGADLREEFLSYWPEPGSQVMYSICPAPVPTGPICVAVLGRAQLHLAAPDRKAAELWASRTGKALGRSKPGFAIAMRELFAPPRFAEQTKLADLLRLVDEHAGPPVRAEMQQWLDRVGLPAHVLLSAPPPKGGQHVEIGVSIRQPSGRDANRWQDGFRPGHVPKSRQVTWALNTTVARLGVQRLDAPFLVERGGGSPALLDKTVTVIGCGAVGAHAAMLLAASGVGALRLIDPETLGPENVHRHALGASDVGQHKVAALKEQLQRRFPHVEVVGEAKEVLSVLAQQPDVVTAEVDAVLVAVGDETVERRLNRLLPPNLNRVHVWLEPLGLGGHLLVTGLEQPGCYHCLYRLDESDGLVNMASFVAPGQSFQRTLGGCGGTFTPYGAMDAERAAVEAATALTELLLGRTAKPYLQSWLQSSSTLTGAGHRMSALGLGVPPGTSRSNACFVDPGCQTCRAW